MPISRRSAVLANRPYPNPLRVLVACGVAFLATGASIVLAPVASEPTVHTWGASLLPTVSLKPNDSDTEAGASLLVQIRNRAGILFSRNRAAQETSRSDMT